jgi:hypothetical protein
LSLQTNPSEQKKKYYLTLIVSAVGLKRPFFNKVELFNDAYS